MVSVVIYIFLCVHSYIFIGNRKKLGIEHDFDQSLEIRYSGI